MPPMTQYSSVAGPNAAAIDATFDISATVLATLTTAAEFAPLPFLQQASIFALAILSTVRVRDSQPHAYPFFEHCREQKITKNPSKPWPMTPGAKSDAPNEGCCRSTPHTVMLHPALQVSKQCSLCGDKYRDKDADPTHARMLRQHPSLGASLFAPGVTLAKTAVSVLNEIPCGIRCRGRCGRARRYAKRDDTLSGGERQARTEVVDDLSGVVGGQRSPVYPMGGRIPGSGETPKILTQGRWKVRVKSGVGQNISERKFGHGGNFERGRSKVRVKLCLVYTFDPEINAGLGSSLCHILAWHMTYVDLFSKAEAPKRHQSVNATQPDEFDGFRRFPAGTFSCTLDQDDLFQGQFAKPDEILMPSKLGPKSEKIKTFDYDNKIFGAKYHHGQFWLNWMHVGRNWDTTHAQLWQVRKIRGHRQVPE
ncbi:hypothetical protein DFH06DRAFT_1131022 [Mycena polygramma]|nr:hypothetical protein DFH06DRAFT_1131022 [Mycena polygramma]